MKDIYQKKGGLELFKESIRFTFENTRDKVMRIGPIDDYCYGYSLKKLEESKRGEDDCVNVMDTLWIFKDLGQYKSIKPHQNKQELMDATNHINDMDKDINTILELGSANGGSFYTWIRCLEPSLAISADLTLSEHQQRFFQYFRNGTEIQTISGDTQSDKIFNKITETIETGVDLVFIDADHSYGGVKSDWMQYKEIVKPGGIIAFHDINEGNDNWVEMPELWNELSESYETSEFVSEEQGGGIGFVYL